MADKTTMRGKEKNHSYVALVLPELRIGGAQKVFLTLAKQFCARGLRVDLVLLSEEGELLAELPEGVQLVVLGQHPFSIGLIALTRKILALIKYLRRNRPDSVLSTLTGTNLFTIVGCVLSQVPLRLVIREASPLVNLRNSILFLMMRLLYSKADFVVVPTDRMKRELFKNLRLSSEKIIQIGNPLDSEKIERESMESLPDDFDCSLPYILSVGRLAPPKDFFTLLKAFAKLESKREMRLVILGEGPDRYLLEELVCKLSITENVELRGFDANPYRWMRRASVFVLSSRWEGCPNVVIEAQSLGIPIIISQYDVSAGELVGRKNQLFPVGDVEVLAQLLREVAEVRGVKNQPSLYDVASDYLKVLGYEH
jgi:glycosyltransferase involved in cell wall biosynthesis